MINYYDSVVNDNGSLINGRTKLFIKKVSENGDIEQSLSGTRCVPEGAGTMLIVDDWIVGQLDKLLFINGELVVKDGEELVPPVKSELDLEEEELKRQLADIQRRRAEKANEPPAEVDKTADELPGN